MDWLARVGGILDNYADERRRPQPEEVERDFETYSQVAPHTTLADGLAAAFRSDRTPPFAQMLGDLFRRSGASQRQSVLNQLAAALGPVLLKRRGIQATANG